MAAIFRLPHEVPVTSAGIPYPGAKAYIYLTGTNTLASVWTDKALTIAGANPIVADAAGVFPLRWLDESITYKLTLTTSADVLIYSEDPAFDPLVTLATLGAILYPRTAAEIAAGVTVVQGWYLPGELYRYGTNTTPGTTDMTSTAQAWAAVGGNLKQSYADIVLVSGVITLVSNTSLWITEGATFKTNTAGLSVFKATSKTNVFIRGGKVQQTATSGTAHIGLVEFNACTYCEASGMELVGHQWAGVLLDNSSYCNVEDNYIHDGLGNGADTDRADILLYDVSSFNTITNNKCYGGTAIEHGICIINPGGFEPTRNIVKGNRIGAHCAYGIVNYSITHNNAYNEIIGNFVEGITGTSLAGTSGAGIYIQGVGGTIVANNTVRNCAISTSSAALLPAGISFNLDSAGVPCRCIGNIVIDMAQYYGIEVAGSCDVIGNTVSFAAGVAATLGIYVNAGSADRSNIAVRDNQVSIATSIASSHGIFAFANSGNLSNIDISGNVINGTSSYGIRIDQTGGKTTSNFTVNGNNITGGSAASIPLGIYSAALGAVAGNVAVATTTFALDLSAVTQTRFTGNSLTTTGATSVNTVGTCTSSYFDKSNYQNTGVKNAATGLLCEQFGAAVPGAGFNSAVGDAVEQSVPVVGNPKRWRCTVSGNPGTWVSEGNL